MGHPFRCILFSVALAAFSLHCTRQGTLRNAILGPFLQAAQGRVVTGAGVLPSHLEEVTSSPQMLQQQPRAMTLL